MFEKGSWLRFQERVDTFVSRLTRNKVTEQKVGKMTLVIHERRRGRWTKVHLDSDPEAIPLRGKEHDIVYTVFDGVFGRKRLGEMAKEQQLRRSVPLISPAT